MLLVVISGLLAAIGAMNVCPIGQCDDPDPTTVNQQIVLPSGADLPAIGPWSKTGGYRTNSTMPYGPNCDTEVEQYKYEQAINISSFMHMIRDWKDETLIYLEAGKALSSHFNSYVSTSIFCPSRIVEQICAIHQAFYRKAYLVLQPHKWYMVSPQEEVLLDIIRCVIFNRLSETAIETLVPSWLDQFSSVEQILFEAEYQLLNTVRHSEHPRYLAYLQTSAVSAVCRLVTDMPRDMVTAHKYLSLLFPYLLWFRDIFKSHPSESSCHRFLLIATLRHYYTQIIIVGETLLHIMDKDQSLSDIRNRTEEYVKTMKILRSNLREDGDYHISQSDLDNWMMIINLVNEARSAQSATLE